MDLSFSDLNSGHGLFHALRVVHAADKMRVQLLQNVLEPTEVRDGFFHLFAYVFEYRGQLVPLALGHLTSAAGLRRIVENSFPTQTFTPGAKLFSDTARTRFNQLEAKKS